MERLIVLVPANVKRQFVEKCRKDGKSVGLVLREWVYKQLRIPKKDAYLKTGRPTV